MFEFIIMIIRWGIFWIYAIPACIIDVVNGVMLYLGSAIRMLLFRGLWRMQRLVVNEDEANLERERVRKAYCKIMLDLATKTVGYYD